MLYVRMANVILLEEEPAEVDDADDVRTYVEGLKTEFPDVKIIFQEISRSPLVIKACFPSTKAAKAAEEWIDND